MSDAGAAVLEIVAGLSETMNTPPSQTLRLTAELQAAHAEIWRQQQLIGQLEQQVAALQARIETLHLGDREAYIAELQEQVLQQASQAAEREAAVQYWKEQSLKHQRHALQLSTALDRLLTEREPPADPAPPAAKPTAKGAIALPGFLGRRSLTAESQGA